MTVKLKQYVWMLSMIFKIVANIIKDQMDLEFSWPLWYSRIICYMLHFLLLIPGLVRYRFYIISIYMLLFVIDDIIELLTPIGYTNPFNEFMRKNHVSLSFVAVELIW